MIRTIIVMILLGICVNVILFYISSAKEIGNFLYIQIDMLKNDRITLFITWYMSILVGFCVYLMFIGLKNI